MKRTSRGDARGRILDTAYELFSHEGVRAVGVDRIVRDSGVAKMTLYSHFASKDELVRAFLDLRDERWTRGWLQVEVERRAATPADRPLALFDVLDEWFHRADYEGCPLIVTMLEIRDPADPIHQDAVGHIDAVRAMVQGHLEQAGASDPEQAAHALHILMMGAIVSASHGDLDAGRRARGLAELLLGAAG